MALRPLAFGIRFKDSRPGGRTVRVAADRRNPERYVTEVRRGQHTRRREHSSLLGALGDFAACWRDRLN